MGLAERRAIQSFQQQHYPALKKEIDDAAGFEVAIDVRWDTLAEEGMSHLYDEYLPKVFFQVLSGAFRAICIDHCPAQLSTTSAPSPGQPRLKYGNAVCVGRPPTFAIRLSLRAAIASACGA